MRILSMRMLLTMTVVLAATANGFAAEGHVAEQTLASMGLAGLETLSDAEGETIRGQGKFYFAYANTASATAVPGAFNLSGSGATNPNTSGANSDSFSIGFYKPYFLPPMSTLAGAQGFAFAAR
jgi:hypothetical protein